MKAFQRPAAVSLSLEAGYRNISNEYSIETKIDREHPELRTYAEKQRWWNGKTEFNFATVYSYSNTARIEAANGRRCEGRKLLQKSQGVWQFSGRK